MAEHLLGISRK